MFIDLENLSFEYQDSPALTQKLERFNSAGSAMIHLILDFDRTLTVAKDPAVEATSWQVMEHQMPREGKLEYADLFNTYRKFELDGTLTTTLAKEWWDRSLSLLTKYSVNLKKVEDTFLDTIGMRAGASELFGTLDKQRIPAVILSAGVKNIIDILLAQNSVKPPLVLSTKLITNTDGVVTGWHPETVVHVLNKNELKHAELDKIRSERPFSIVIGDSLDDAKMAAGEEDVLRIRVVDPRPDENIEVALEKTFTKFDLAISNGNLNSVVKLIEGIPA